MATAPSELPTIDRAVMEYESSRRLPDEAFNKLVFAVDGHAGSGTSVVANQLSNVLFDTKVGEGAFEAEILKARDVIAAWATKKALAASRTRLSPRGGSCPSTPARTCAGSGNCGLGGNRRPFCRW